MSKPLNRRAFLATGAVAAAGLAIAAPRPAGAATELTVYRLRADWGYPVGPKDKTRCTCRSCFRRAENAYFLTLDAAIAGRVHPCCLCQPYQTTVPGVSRYELFLDEQSADRRDPRVAAALDHATTAPPDPLAALIGADPERPASGATPAMSFARTGTTLGLAGVGAGVVSIGAALVAFRNRRTSPPSLPRPTSPSAALPQPKEPS
jgi:hypothetical protein